MFSILWTIIGLAVFVILCLLGMVLYLFIDQIIWERNEMKGNNHVDTSTD